jgi:cellulose synthase operon protein YhjU
MDDVVAWRRGSGTSGERLNMGWWGAYFFAKLLLYAGGYIDFDVWWNLLLAAFTALPASNDRQRLTKNMIASVVSVVLLYHDSWLPPVARVLSLAGDVADFSPLYMAELLGRFINIKVIADLALLLAVYALLKRKLRMSTFVFIGIAAVMVAPGLMSRVQAISQNGVAVNAAGAATMPTEMDLHTLDSAALEQKVTAFYNSEQQRQVRFARVGDDATPFDIILLHVCSLSWDDIDDVGARNDALLKRFDITFTDFNSAASYSGPAAIRLLRGNCGQVPHKQLYQAAQRDCLVMDGFQDAGFTPQWVMNHDGHFGNFFADVHERGGMPVQLEDSSGATVAQHSFDGTPVYDDYSVLSRWWQQRLQNPAKRVALYYNTISLHDGNRVVDGDSSYARRLASFTDDIERFLDQIQRSGRHVVVVFIPEHGAAVRGDKRQIQGLREVPTPAITHVPVGVMLINVHRDAGQTALNVNTPVSYLAVNELLSRFMTDNPFAKTDLSLTGYVQNLQKTDSVAENEGTLMLSQGKQAMMRTPDGIWSRWDTG